MSPCEDRDARIITTLHDIRALGWFEVCIDCAARGREGRRRDSPVLIAERYY